MNNNRTSDTDNEGKSTDQGAFLEVNTPSQIRELHAWLSEDPAVRGWIQVIEREPPAGALGPIAEAIQIIVGAPGTAITTVAGVIIAWLRYRTSDVKVTIRQTKDGNEVEVNARRIKTLNSEQTQAVTEQIRATLAGEISAQRSNPTSDG